MNIISLRQRLERLDAEKISVVVLSKPDPLLTVLQVLIAHHLGNATPSDTIAAAVTRGLGYENSQDLMIGLRADRGTSDAADPGTRWRNATCRLLALKGAMPDCDGPTFGATVEALFAEMPGRLQHHPTVAEFGFVSRAD